MIERLSPAIQVWEEITHHPEILLRLLAKLFEFPSGEIAQVVQKGSCAAELVCLGGYSATEKARKLIEADEYRQVVEDFTRRGFSGNQTFLMPGRIGSFGKSSEAVQVIAVPVFYLLRGL